MSIGYPDVRGRDINSLSEEFVNKNPIVRAFLPSMSRVHTLRTRVGNLAAGNAVELCRTYL